MLLSGRVDISRTYCIIRNEVFFFFLRSSRRGRLREKVTVKLLIERKKERREKKRERERERKVRREV